MEIKTGSVWWAGSGNRFVVIGTTFVEGHDWVHYRSEKPRATGIHIGQKTGTIRCISRIKEHFGVEE